MNNADAMDPRKRFNSIDPRKRHPSQSPERARPPKQTRAWHSTEPTSPKDADRSRKSSVSDGAAPARAGAPASDIRRPSTQLKSDLRREADGGIKSPMSPLNGQESGRSTPRKGSASIEPGANPILAALQAFSTAATTQALDEIERRQANNRYKHATDGYESSRAHHGGFPALRDMRTKSRQEALEASQKAKETASKHLASQKKKTENLATLIGSASSRTDTLSRDINSDLLSKHETIVIEYNELSKKFNTLQQYDKDREQEVAQLKAELKRTANSAAKAVEEAKSASDKAAEAAHISKDLRADTSTAFGEVKADAAKALRVSDGAKIAADNAVRMAGQVSRVGEQANSLAVDIERLSKDRKVGSATQSKEVSSHLEQTNPKVEALRSELATLKIEVSTQYALKKEVGKYGDRLDTLVPEVAGISKNNRSLLEQVKPLPTLLASVKEVEQKVTEMSRDVESLSSNVNDAGKGTVKERLTRLDHAVNNLTIQLGDHKTAIPQRITTVEKKLANIQEKVDAMKSLSSASQGSLEEGEILSQRAPQQGNLISRVPDLEKKYSALREEVDDVKKRIRVDSPSGHVDADGDVLGRLSDLELKFKSLEEVQEEKDELVVQRDASVKRELKSVSKQNQDKFEKLDEALTGAQKNIGRVEEALQSKISRENYNQGLAAVITPVREDVRKLQGQLNQLQQKQRQTPASTSTPQPPAFGQSPQLPNGVGSPHINGAPRIATPAQGRAPTPQGQPPQDLTRLQAQVDSIIGAQQHLKQRVDNMVTDEVVKVMCDQMGNMYPEARNFSSSHKALAKRTDAIEAEVREVKASVAGTPADLYSLRTRTSKLEGDLREANAKAKRKEQEVAGVKDSTTKLAMEAKKTTAAPAPAPAPANSVTANDLTALREELEEVRATAKKADILSKGHSTRFSNLNLCEKTMNNIQIAIANMQENGDNIEALEAKVEGLRKDYDGLARETKDATAAAKLFAEFQERLN